MLGNLKVYTRLWFLLVILMFFLVTLVGIAFYTLSSTKENLDKIVNTNNNLERYAFELLEGNDRVVKSLFYIFASENEKEKLAELERIKEIRATVNEYRKKTQELIVKGSRGEEIFKNAEENLVTVREANNVVIDFLKSGKNQEAFDHYSKVSTVHMGKQRGILGDFMEYQKGATQEAYQKAKEQASSVVRWVVVYAIFVITVTVLTFFLIIRSITNPLNLGVDRMSDLAQGEGDLTKKIDLKTKDELGELGGWIDKFIEKIHDNVVLIDKTSTTVASNARDLKEASLGVTSGTEEMSIQAQRITSASTQMSQNLLNVSSAIEEMSITVQEVAKKAKDAASIVSNASNTVQVTNKIVSELEESAMAIGKVIESISSIASQTNLLALNAAIEAAGAGDAGKGFAVVAQEVKQLATQAGRSSEEIKNMILGIQRSSRRTAESIGKIKEIIKVINEISSAIASAVEEQSITSREVASNITQTAIAANEVTKNVEAIGQAASTSSVDASNANTLALELDELSRELAAVVNQFKVNRN